MTQEEIINRRIENSVKWLDVNAPNWLNKVNIKSLDMTNNCVLDQVFGYYENVCDKYPELENDDYMFNENLSIDTTYFWIKKINELRENLIKA